MYKKSYFHKIKRLLELKDIDLTKSIVTIVAYQQYWLLDVHASAMNQNVEGGFGGN